MKEKMPVGTEAATPWDSLAAVYSGLKRKEDEPLPRASATQAGHAGLGKALVFNNVVQAGERTKHCHLTHTLYTLVLFPPKRTRKIWSGRRGGGGGLKSLSRPTAARAIQNRSKHMITKDPSISSSLDRNAWCCCSGVRGSAYPAWPATTQPHASMSGKCHPPRQQAVEHAGAAKAQPLA